MQHIKWQISLVYIK